jgi:hypothetical protein
MPIANPPSSLPQAVLDQLGSLQFFNTVELGPNLFGTNIAEIKRDFQMQGYLVRAMKFKKWEQN